MKFKKVQRYKLLHGYLEKDRKGEWVKLDEVEKLVEQLMQAFILGEKVVFEKEE